MGIYFYCFKKEFEEPLSQKKKSTSPSSRSKKCILWTVVFLNDRREKKSPSDRELLLQVYFQVKNKVPVFNTFWGSVNPKFLSWIIIREAHFDFLTNRFFFFITAREICRNQLQIYKYVFITPSIFSDNVVWCTNKLDKIMMWLIDLIWYHKQVYIWERGKVIVIIKNC
jgi:hypothetical protein